MLRFLAVAALTILYILLGGGRVEGATNTTKPDVYRIGGTCPSTYSLVCLAAFSKKPIGLTCRPGLTYTLWTKEQGGLYKNVKQEGKCLSADADENLKIEICGTATSTPYQSETSYGLKDCANNPEVFFVTKPSGGV